MSDDEYKTWLRDNGAEPSNKDDAPSAGILIWGWGGIAWFAYVAVKFLIAAMHGKPH